jgi:hypothetical protein
VVFWEKVNQNLINEYRSKWYNEKEQPLLYRKIQKEQAQNIALVKFPNTHLSKPIVPNNENCCSYNYGRE